MTSPELTRSSIRLDEGDFCYVQIAEHRAELRCVVVAFTGADVLLLTADRHAEQRLAPGVVRADAFLLPYDDGARGGVLHRWAQEGRVDLTADHRQCVFRSNDGFFVAQRRRHSRAPVQLPVTVHGDVPEPGRSATLDISVSGFRLPPAAGGQAGGHATFTLHLPGADVRAAAHAVGDDPAAACYAFDNEDAERTAQLSSLVLGWHAQHLPDAMARAVADAHRPGRGTPDGR